MKLKITIISGILKIMIATLALASLGELERATAVELPLSRLADGDESRVVRVALGEEAAAYLRAVGIEEGVLVKVLRRAALGGPLHVRTSSGAELAVDRDLARSIEVAG